jgi:hypothetical protein
MLLAVLRNASQGPDNAYLQTQLRELEPRHGSVVANTHVHAPPRARRDIDLLNQRHLLDQLSGLLVALLPCRVCATLRTRVPRRTQPIERHTRLVRPDAARGEQQHGRSNEGQEPAAAPAGGELLLARKGQGVRGLCIPERGLAHFEVAGALLALQLAVEGERVVLFEVLQRRIRFRREAGGRGLEVVVGRGIEPSVLAPTQLMGLVGRHRVVERV